MLLGAVVDSWDRLREAAVEALLAMRAPLPGLGQPGGVAGLLRWARRLVAAPRVRESDAGAAALQLPCCARSNWLALLQSPDHAHSVVSDEGLAHEGWGTLISIADE